ncbi:MAG: thioredoxin fold domain-containing protein [Phycisphaerales bacterium JB059]
MKAVQIGLLVIAALLVVAALAPRFFGGGKVAPTPTVFDTSVSLDDALRRSDETGRPVFALVTADWCPPCQGLKRHALTDARVQRLLERSTEPVYITDQNGHDVERLGVTAFPTSFILRDGEVLASLRGSAPPDAYLEWLESNLPAGQANASP